MTISGRSQRVSLYNLSNLAKNPYCKERFRPIPRGSCISAVSDSETVNQSRNPGKVTARIDDKVMFAMNAPGAFQSHFFMSAIMAFLGRFLSIMPP
jgi:hypothetical protein